MPERADNNKHSRIRYTLIFAILVAIYAIALGVIAYPYAKVNAENADLAKHMRLYREAKSIPASNPMPVCLYSINGPVIVERSIETFGRDSLHSALEAMLLPLSDEEIERGLVSYIPKKTELIGVTDRNGYIFAEFSNELMFSSSLDRAIDQIERTIKETIDPQGITIISDGLEIN